MTTDSFARPLKIALQPEYSPGSISPHFNSKKRKFSLQLLWSFQFKYLSSWPLLYCSTEEKKKTMVKYLITSGNSQSGKATIVALKKLGENDIVAGARYAIMI